MKKAQSGFTLLELMLVVTIVAIDDFALGALAGAFGFARLASDLPAGLLITITCGARWWSGPSPSRPASCAWVSAARTGCWSPGASCPAWATRWSC